MNNLEKEPKKEAGKKSYLEGVTSIKWKEEAPEKRKKWSKGKKIGAVVIVLVIIASLVAVLEGLETIGVSNALIQKYKDLKKLGLETSQEALDKFTKATGIKFFDSKEKTASSLSVETPEAPFTGLEIQGLNHVWQNNRWEYVDPNDNLVAGYWNDKEGKFELTSSVLKGEWSGLFVPKMAADIEKILAEKNTDEDWTVEKWESGEAKIPIPFMITRGGNIEETKVNALGILKRKNALLVSDLPSETVIVCPLYQIDGQFGPITKPYSVEFAKGRITMNFVVPQKNNDLSYFSDVLMHKIDQQTNQTEKIKLGTNFMELGNNENLSTGSLIPIAAFSKNLREAQILIFVEESVNGGYFINTSLKNFLTDDKGRFIFTITQPIPEEIDISQQPITVIREETQNVTSETEKKVSEENLETSSLIKKTETAPEVEGLEFDKKTGFYLAKEINDYGLKKDTKAGIFKNGFLGLRPEVINFLQQQEESFKIPLPFNPEDIKDVQVAEEEHLGIVIRLAKEATVYSPLNGFCYNGQIIRSYSTKKGSYDTFNFRLEGTDTELTISSKEIEYYPHKEKVVIGDKLGVLKQDVVLELHSKNTNVENIYQNILKIGDVPVFILPNE